MIKYYKNFILCGEIDFHCILCEESFQHVIDVDKHILWEKHRKILKRMDYIPKLKKELVYKIENKYYCEACNFIVSKFDAMKSHVKSETHTQNKANPPTELKPSLLKREYNFIRMGKAMVSLNEWHGLVKKQCLLCDVPVMDVDDHVGLSSHMINYIQAKLKNEDEENYYREMETHFYCFKCKERLPLDSLKDHWTSEVHCKNKTQSEQYFDVDKDNDLVTCRVCKETMEFTFQAVYCHRDFHRGPNYKEKECDDVQEEAFRLLMFPDHGKRRHELKLFGQDNFIKLISGGAKGYCSLCCTYISANMRNFKQHVKGARHTGFLENKGLIKRTKKPEKRNYRIKPMHQFLKSIVHIKEITAFFINREICVDSMSFLYLCPIEHKPDKMCCFLCDGEYPFNLMEHFKTQHKQNYMNTLVTSLNNEFIREIRPDTLHCGYCNQIFPTFSVLEKHLKSFKHKSSVIRAASMVKYAKSSQIVVRGSRESTDLMRTIDLLD